MSRVVPSQVVAVIDRLFPGITAQIKVPTKEVGISHIDSGRLTAIVDLIDMIPDELLILEGDEYIKLVVSRSEIRSTLAIWQTQGATGLLRPGFGKLNPVTNIRQALEKCPDEYPPAEIEELSFVNDDELRQSLRIDLAATKKALSNGEWKASTVLAGSVIEALLLWRLKQRTPSDISNATKKLLANKILSKPLPRNDLEKRDLHTYLELAAELEEIEPQTVTSVKLAKDFRNLIHPGRAQRLGQVCDRGTAHGAYSAVNHVIRDLTP